MSNIFQRVIDVQSLHNKSLSDYKPDELVAFITTAYPYDPKGALKLMREKYMVGELLGREAELLLEGLLNVKSK